jgi:hypothetical protein
MGKHERQAMPQEGAMTLTGPDRDEVFRWDPSEPELMKAMILSGVQIQMPIGKGPSGELLFPEPVAESPSPAKGD